MVSCEKEQEATVKTHYGLDAPISQAEQIDGVWVFKDNIEKYKAEKEAKLRAEFNDYVRASYKPWIGSIVQKKETEELWQLSEYAVAKKYPMTLEFFGRSKKFRGFDPVMLEWFKELDHTPFIEQLDKKEPTTRTFYGKNVPYSEAEKINGRWVAKINLEKYKTEYEARLKEKFEGFVKNNYKPWVRAVAKEKREENLSEHSYYEVAQKYPMTLEYFERVNKGRRYFDPVMLEWFKELDHTPFIENLSKKDKPK